MNNKMTRKFFSTLLAVATFCLLALLAAPTTTFAGSKLDFTFVNDTGYTIKALYISGNDEEDWGDDVLGKGVQLADGESSEITFEKSADKQKNAAYDFKIMFTDGSTEYWRNFDLSTISEIAVHYKNGKCTATWK